ncbi:MAG TPA: hypothetical protein VMB71_04730, partial [Acetobacteraceae bacterium]|nr:hypothetical protein [Acetobacteraceae bacterium]
NRAPTHVDFSATKEDSSFLKERSKELLTLARRGRFKRADSVLPVTDKSSFFSKKNCFLSLP